MPLTDSFSGLVALAVACYLAWRIVRPFIVKSPFDNLLGPPSDSWLRGNFREFFNRHCFEYRDELFRKYGYVYSIRGPFGQTLLQVSDPKAMQSIFIKEQHIYEENVTMFRTLLGPGLLSTLGEQHKRQRKMLNPVFSTKHLREMTPIFYSVIHKTRDAIMLRVKNAAKEGVELDMLSWMGRTTLEILGQAGLGHSFDPLTKDVADEFATAVKEFFPALLRTLRLNILLPYVSNIGTPAFRRRIVEMLPLKDVQRLRTISDTMYARSVLIFNEKKSALEKGDEALKQQIGEGRDIMSILLRENIMASDQDKLPDDELIAQVSIMILAGMDTTANSLARLLHLLAIHPDVQEKLRAEMISAAEAEGHDGMLDFDKIMELPYLEAVCRETLRAFPGVAGLPRQTNADTVLPLTNPVRLRDGTLATSLPVPKGSRVIANLMACNHDPALWGEDAKEWRPSRWLEPLPRAVEEAHIPGVYSHMMTFIGGSRACIGFKMAQVEIKTVLFVLLQHFKFELTNKPIAWNLAGVIYPTESKEAVDPGLPLKVSLLRP